MRPFARNSWLHIVSVSAVATGCGIITAMPDHVDEHTDQQSTGGATSIATETGGSTSTDQTGLSDTPVGRHGQLQVQGTLVLDEHGTPVQLKGPSSMWLNWESRAYAESKDGLRYMRDNWNAKLIRAAMGITPTNGYLRNPSKAKAQVKTIVQNAIDLGMYVIIDWHEETADQHQAESVAFFTEMAQAYGSYPNVIYETFNEPVDQAWSTVLKPYHEAVIAAIRGVDPDNLIVLGTGNYSQYVDDAAEDPIKLPNLLYTLHFYSCSHGVWLRNRASYALSRGIALFVTEWGATNADGGTTGSLCLDEAQTWHDWMNSNHISWAAWKLDQCRDLSCYFKSSAPVDGGWTDEQLNGHGPFVRDRMREQPDQAADAY